MVPAHGGRISGPLLTSAAKASSLLIKVKCLAALLFAMLLSFCTLVNRVTQGILASCADHWPAPPGPEKSTVQIYRSAVDWLAHIFTPINTFTALLMPPLGINKVGRDSAKNQAAQGRAQRHYCVRGKKGKQVALWKERHLGFTSSSCFQYMTKRRCFILWIRSNIHS